MRNILISVIIIGFSILLFSSCSTKKSIVYLQDMDEKQEYPILQKYEPIIHRDDKLRIIVSCKSPELAIPFNFPGTAGTTYSVSQESVVTAKELPISGGRNSDGYIVDVDGNIDFPILGKIHAEGMTRLQLTDTIKDQLVRSNYIKDPIVLIDFINFKISVLGEVASKGTFDITGDRITLLEAIAMAGDLTENARIDRVAVLREYGNKRRIFFTDLRSKDVFSSPCYYLQQNDIIYVEPSSMKSTQKSQQKLQILSVWLGFISTLTSLTFLFIKK